jgi:hypothetical protein
MELEPKADTGKSEVVYEEVVHHPPEAGLELIELLEAKSPFFIMWWRKKRNGGKRRPVKLGILCWNLSTKENKVNWISRSTFCMGAP